tara:strand:- start:311 stop:517 length:207 start_codon:yes stop_codon:yes gene_type:complete
MGIMGQKSRSVKLVVDGMDEMDVRLDDFETKVDDVITLLGKLTKEIESVKKLVADKPSPKKASPKRKP